MQGTQRGQRPLLQQQTVLASTSVDTAMHTYLN